MKHKLGMLLLTVVLFFYAIRLKGDEHGLRATETFVTEPIDTEYIAIWVPVAQAGPFINRACIPKSNYEYSFILPTNVCHTKSEDCPAEVARLLAEYTSVYHRNVLPLTIFNGWKWEYLNNLDRCETITYDLDDHGGCWENSWEGILTLNAGSICFKSLDSGNSKERAANNIQQSTIEVQTFSSITRTRDGYPQKRKLQ